jgi:RimJ/RimL family protein N-acetyltransferase
MPNHAETNPTVIKTDLPGVTLQLMTDTQDDFEYLQLQERNSQHIVEFGNTVDTTPEEVTARRVGKGIVRFGIRTGENLAGAVEYIPGKIGEDVEVGIVLDSAQTGKGLGLTAVKAMTSLLAPQYKRLFAEIDPRHERSLRLFEQAGYTRQSDIVEREWGPAVVMEYLSPQAR